MSFRKKIIPLSVAVACALPMAVIAAPVMFATADGTLGSPPAGIGGPYDSGPNSTNVDVLEQRSDGAGNNLFFHPYGYNSGGYTFFGSRASGGGIYDGTARFSLTDTVTNTGAATPWVFNFVVDAGEVSASCTPCTGGGSASVALQIRFDPDAGDDSNEVVVGQGRVNLTIDPDGTYRFNHGGLASGFTGIGASGQTGPTPPGVSFGWNSTDMSIALGTIASGQTFRLEYDLIARATGNFANGPLDCFGGYGGEGLFQGQRPDGENPVNVQINEFGGGGEGFSLCTNWDPGTQARSGDPITDPGTTPDGRYFVGPAAVPEPASTALLGLGLGAALLAGRRKKKKPE